MPEEHHCHQYSGEEKYGVLPYHRMSIRRVRPKLARRKQVKGEAGRDLDSDMNQETPMARKHAVVVHIVPTVATWKGQRQKEMDVVQYHKLKIAGEPAKSTLVKADRGSAQFPAWGATSRMTSSKAETKLETNTTRANVRKCFGDAVNDIRDVRTRYI
jgi:hypothetical protein